MPGSKGGKAFPQGGFAAVANPKDMFIEHKRPPAM
jgi:hypothetical protein